jgi:hypothetical protein
MRHLHALPVAFSMAMVAAAAARPQTAPPSQLDAGYRKVYELEFDQAREQFAAWEKAHPEDPLGPASEAASYLYEEFYQQGVFTSDFFLDDKKLLGGVQHPADPRRRAAFLAANRRAQGLAKRLLQANPRDPGALLALTMTIGMQADYAGLIEKRQLESLRLVRQAEGHAAQLLAANPNAQDAYLALGAADYIIGCLPGYKRFFLWFGGIHGDRERGMNELEQAAAHGRYLRPFAKALLALADLREKRPEQARSLLHDLVAEFPENPVFARELARLEKSGAPQR